GCAAEREALVGTRETGGIASEIEVGLHAPGGGLDPLKHERIEKRRHGDGGEDGHDHDHDDELDQRKRGPRQAGEMSRQITATLFEEWSHGDTTVHFGSRRGAGGSTTYACLKHRSRGL